MNLADLPHRSRQCCNLSLAEGQESPRDAFPQELSQLNGPNFLGVGLLLVIRDAFFWDVGSDFLRFPLVVVVKLLRGLAFFFFLQEHQLRVEQEAALFWQVSCCPLGRENVENRIKAPPLASSCEGDDGVQVFTSTISYSASEKKAEFPELAR